MAGGTRPDTRPSPAGGCGEGLPPAARNSQVAGLTRQWVPVRATRPASRSGPRRRSRASPTAATRQASCSRPRESSRPSTPPWTRTRSGGHCTPASWHQPRKAQAATQTARFPRLPPIGHGIPGTLTWPGTPLPDGGKPGPKWTRAAGLVRPRPRRKSRQVILKPEVRIGQQPLPAGWV
jgi:hypothetical protein